jgi:ABC-type phosphate transport system auxiliary subunit
MELEKRMDRVERRIDAIAKLVQQGMKLLVQYQEENRYAIRALIDSQQRAEARQDRADARQDRADARLHRTEEMLNKLIQSWQRRGPNGR